MTAMGKHSRRHWVGNRTGRRDGIAMALAIIVVAVTMILAAAYLQEAGVSMRIAHNAVCRKQAQMIAEAGLRMAIAYVRSSSDWRTQRTHGLWVEDRPFAGGGVLDPRGGRRGRGR